MSGNRMETNSAPSDLWRDARLRRTSTGMGLAISLAVTAVSTLLCIAMFPLFDASNLIMVYLAGVSFVASRFGVREALLSSIFSVAAFDFFLVHPFLTFAVSDFQFIVTFAVMLAVGVLISGQSLRIREQAQLVIDREVRTASLYEFSKRLTVARTREDLAAVAGKGISELFDCSAELFLPAGDDLNTVGEGPHNLPQFDRQAVRRAYESPVKSTSASSNGAEVYLPLVAAGNCQGVLAIRPAGGPDSSRQNLFDTLANQLSMALERINLEDAARARGLAIEREQLRNTLLSSVSHDIRTPLAVITGASSVLVKHADELQPNNRELVQTIDEESKRLDRLIRNILDMTRLSSGPIELRRDWHSIEELIGSALSRTESLLGAHRVELDIPELPLIYVDGMLLEQLFVNILENDAKHTPAGTSIRIVARVVEGRMQIRIEDDGPGLDEGSEERIFNRLERGKKRSTQGFGLGLAICKAIAELHGGSIRAEQTPTAGACFALTLPMEHTAPEVPVG
jgi:two-component system sensor histidine kinase KdpD